MEITEIVESAELAERWRDERIAETNAMRKAMEAEEGLLNIPQTALILEVSRARVGELMKLGILKRFEFFGQVYLSFREIAERRTQEIKAGRPARGFWGALKTGVRAAAHTDRHQLKQGGFAGPHEKKLERERKTKRRKKNT
jgi:hypothetical protein